jgi:ribosome-associated protein
LEGKSEESDYMVIASGNSVTQVSALSERIIVAVKKELKVQVRTEGLDNSDWVLLDCGDVIVHVFRHEVREFYQLEKMWQNPKTSQSILEN